MFEQFSITDFKFILLQLYTSNVFEKMANNALFRLAARNTLLASRSENISQENALMRATIEELSCKVSIVFLSLFSGNVSFYFCIFVIFPHIVFIVAH